MSHGRVVAFLRDLRVALNLRAKLECSHVAQPSEAFLLSMEIDLGPVAWLGSIREEKNAVLVKQRIIVSPVSTLFSIVRG